MSIVKFSSSRKSPSVALIAGLFIALCLLLLAAIFYENGFFIRLIQYRNPTSVDHLHLPVNIVKAGDPRSLDPPSGNLEVDQKLRGILERDRTVLFVVSRGNDLLLEEYFEKDAKDAVWNSFSIAKGITSLLVGVAVQRGLVSVDQRASEYIDDWKQGDRRQEITIENLLTMRSGLDWREDVPPFHWDLVKSYYGFDLRKMVMQRLSAFNPGEKWRYSGADTMALSFILEKATGKTMPALASEWLWTPIHAEHDAQWATDFKGQSTKAFSNFFATGRDLLRVGMLIANGGAVDGSMIIDQKYFGRMISPVVSRSALDGEKPIGYGYQWWVIGDEGHRIVVGRGYLGQLLLVDINQKLVVVKLSRGGDHLSREVITEIERQLPVWAQIPSSAR